MYIRFVAIELLLTLPEIDGSLRLAAVGRKSQTASRRAHSCERTHPTSCFQHLSYRPEEPQTDGGEECHVMGQVSYGDLRLRDSDVRSSFRGDRRNGGIAVAEDEFAV